jgi:uncharacterized repeat protein (TIGR03843 family)
MAQDFSKVKVLGQLSNASNASLLVANDHQKFIYKPQAGERTLWDFPEGTLFQRERAAYVLSEILNWNVVPETVIATGPYGLGSFQEWKEADVTEVDIFEPTQVPESWLNVFSGVDQHGNQVVLAHSDNEQLLKIALFDALINNADRKAGHLITDGDLKIWAVDHGVTFNLEPKLRTVLWGWLDQPIPSQLVQEIEQLLPKINDSELVELLSDSEVDQLLIRSEELLKSGKFPQPNPNWPAVPWPIF